MPCAKYRTSEQHLDDHIAHYQLGQLMASHQSGCNALVFPGKVANQLFDYLGNRTCTLHTPSLSPVVLVGMTINAIYVCQEPHIQRM